MASSSFSWKAKFLLSLNLSLCIIDLTQRPCEFCLFSLSSSMASSSSSSWRYHVFPSFSGQDVRKSFLSHLLKELRRKSIDTFIDNSIERSLPIDPALLLAIKESRISIVIFSKNYASSTWCLNELVEIHKCFKELNQMVIPIFYDVVPSDVRKQTGKFGELFEETCEDKPEDHKQRWMQALRDVAKMAGYDLLKWPDEANLIESITNYVSNKLFTPSSDVGDFVGLEAHLERLSSMLCLESEETRMVGIVGPSGIGKSTIGRDLYSQHFSKFHHHAIVTFKRTINDDYGMKLSWEEQFLSQILGQNDIKIGKLGEVEKRLKHKKVLVVLDDVVELELLKTLVGKTEWFGPGSRIIVITQNRQLLKAHAIDHIYDVEFPSEGLSLEMLCRYAFGKNSPPHGFRELAVEVAKIAGNLPLGLSALGSSLKGRGKDEWVEMMPRLRNDLDGKIEKTLRVSYDRLDKTDQELFLSIACFFKGKKVSVIEDLFGKIGLRTLADKFLIRITPKEAVEMHDLLQKLGIEIDREESKRKPSRRRFLTNAKDIRDVLTDKNGTKTVLGISLEVTESFSIDENSFKGMPNLQYIIVHHDSLMNELIYMTYYKDIKVDLPQGLSYLPRNLKLLKWNYYPAKRLPSNFNAKTLVILTMNYSKLEKMWEGNPPLGSLKKMDMKNSEYLKEIPDLSNAINLEVLNLQGCKSLVTLPSSFQSLESLVTLNLSYCTNLTEIPDLSNAINLEVLNLERCESLVTLPSSFRSLESLVKLNMSICTNLTEIPDLSNAINLEVLILRGCKSLVTLPSWIWNVPTHLNLESLKYYNLKECCQLSNCPQISMIMMNSFAQRIKIEVEDCLWNKNLRGPSYLDRLQKCIPSKFRPEHFVELTVSKIMHKKLWEGVQSLGSLLKLNLSFCKNLTEFPDLSKATNLEYLYIKDCDSLERVPSTIGNLHKLKEFVMSYCEGLEVLPVNVNLASLSRLDLSWCSRLRTFPQISKSIETLILDHTAIEEVPCCIDNFSRLTSLKMNICTSLKNICPNIFRLTHLKVADFSYCAMVTMEGFSRIRIHVRALQLLSNSLESVFDSREEFYRDAKLVLADGREVSFHRCVMSARSPFFKNALAAAAIKEKPELKEIAKDYEVGFDSVATVLAYVYSSRMRPPPKGVSECADENCCHVACRPAVDFMLEVLCLAFIFKIPELVTLYQRHLLDVVDKVVIEDTLVILKLANICAKSCTKLFDRCKEIIVKSDVDIVSLDKSLPQDIVKQIIDNRHELGLEVPKLDKHVSNIHKALDSDDVAFVKMLLTEGHTNLDDAYALHFAVAYCDVKTATDLLDLKLADVNHRNPRGYTVLHVAAMRKEPQLILSLLGKGASASKTTLEGRTALLIAKRATMAVYNHYVPERWNHSLKGQVCVGILEQARVCVEILEQGDKLVTIPRDVPPSPSLVVAAEELKEKLLDLENRVALAQRLFPTEAQVAMEIAQMKGTCEFIVTSHEPDHFTGTEWTSPDVKITPFKILEKHQSRLKALSKTVEIGKRLFPRCSAVLDQIMDSEDLTQLACGEEDTPET